MLRLGGVGSFDDLAGQLVGNPQTPEDLAQLGWDQAPGDFTGLEFGVPVNFELPEGLDLELIERALGAFGAPSN